MDVSTQVVSVAESLAREKAMGDREKYKKFMIKIEEFASKNGLIVGGDMATKLLLGMNAPDLDSFYVELFSDRAAEYALHLVNILYDTDPSGLAHYATMVTRVPGEEFDIKIDTRDLAKIRALPVQRRQLPPSAKPGPTHTETKTSNVIVPTRRRGLFYKDGDLLVMGAEIQLMSTYSALCDPSRSAEWKEGIRRERELRGIMLDEIHAKIDKATASLSVHGGREDDGVGASWWARRHKFLLDLARSFASGPGRVMVGEPAIRALESGKVQVREGKRLHFISENSFDDETAAISKLAKAHNLFIESNTDNPYIPTDPRLRRLTIYVKGHPNAKKDTIVYLFNVGAYELVPYTEGVGKVRIGTIFVLLRFTLVQLWTIQLLLRMGFLQPAVGRSSLLELVEDMKSLSHVLDKTVSTISSDSDDAVGKIFPLNLYVGHWENKEIAKKRLAYIASRRSKKPSPPVYPAADRQESPGSDG